MESIPAVPFQVTSYTYTCSVFNRHYPYYRILVVDDQAVNRHLLVSLLTPIGFEIREARNGQEALDVWNQWQPHAIFLDIRMPVMDGITVARAIRALPHGQETILVAATASVLDDAREEIFAAGFTAFLHKPFQEHELFALLERYGSMQFIRQTCTDSFPFIHSDIRQDMPITLEDLVQLSPDVLQAIGNAALLGDVSYAQEILDTIATIDLSVAQGLRHMFDNFEHAKVIDLITKLQGELQSYEGRTDQ